MSNIPVIAFGSSPGVYYVGLGMRYYAVGMRESMKGTISKWPAIQIKWMSIDSDGVWIVQDAYTGRVEFSTDLIADITERLHAPGAQYFITFGAKGTWAAVASGKAWAAHMEDEQLAHQKEIQAGIGGSQTFSRALTGILFGKGSTMVFMFGVGFSYHTDQEAEGGKLENLMNEYMDRQPPWTIERGSALCTWNVDYFFLKFKDPQSSQIKAFWSLPPDMNENLNDLTSIFQTPEATIAIAQHEQRGMMSALSNLSMAVQTGNALSAVTGMRYYY